MITARSFGSVNYYFCERNVLIVIIVVRRQDEAEHDLQISSLGRFDLFFSWILKRHLATRFLFDETRSFK